MNELLLKNKRSVKKHVQLVGNERRTRMLAVNMCHTRCGFQ